MSYRTHSQGVAALLRYRLGSHTHIRTFIEPKPRGAAIFEFVDNGGECRRIAQAYADGISVSDARALIESFICIRHTLTVALRNRDEWRNPTCPQPV